MLQLLLTFRSTLILLCILLQFASIAFGQQNCRSTQTSTCQRACTQESDREKCFDACLNIRCGTDRWTVKKNSDDLDRWEIQHKCTIEDESKCEKECRKVFGKDNFNCRSRCLHGRCDPGKQEDSETPGNTEEKKRAALKCIEFESTGCKERCAQHRGQKQLRCRRGCLSKRCRKARQSDVMAEAMHPGTTACAGCKQEYRELCKKRCYFGIGVGREYSQTDQVGHVGCVHTCQLISCSKKCDSMFPGVVGDLGF